VKPRILHIETSTKTCSIAISSGLTCIAIAEDHQGEHTAVINSLIREVLKQAQMNLEDLDAISVNEGPGSFTALRIGVVTAKGISYALDKPLILCNGLKAIATEALNLFPEAGICLAMMDARRDEVYLAGYNRRLEEEISLDSRHLTDNLKDELKVTEHTVVICGNGAKKWKDFIENWRPEIADLELSARWMIPLVIEQFKVGNFTKTADAKPLYLKQPNITTPKEKLISH
jgi:tRNA threonylcarbamoyladenosine biosynthesis protein TsaB